MGLDGLLRPFRARRQGHRHRPRRQDEGRGVLGDPVQVLCGGSSGHQGGHGHVPLHIREEVSRRGWKRNDILAARDRGDHRQLELQRT